MVRYVLLGPAWTRSFRCVWMMEELGISNYHVEESMPSSRKVKQFVATGKVPVLLEYQESSHEESPFVLYESSAINSYLADRFNSSLIPPRTNLHQRALYDQTVSCITTELDSQGLWIHRKHEAMAQYFGAIPDAVKHARSQFERINDLLGAQLNPYLMGAEFSAADILYVHCLDWAKGIGWSSPANVESYRQLCQQRPAYQRAKVQRDANVEERRRKKNQTAKL